MNAIEAQPWTQVPARLTALASGIEARQPNPAIMGLLEQAQASCQAAAETTRAPARQYRSPGRADALTQILAQVETATQMWQQVWPRLGGDREFRLAVAREARLWAKRLTEHAER